MDVNGMEFSFVGLYSVFIRGSLFTT